MSLPRPASGFIAVGQSGRTTLGDLVILEEHPLFQAATDRARALALTHGESIEIRRQQSGWAVLAQPALAALLRDDRRDQESMEYVREDDGAWAAEAEYQHEVLEPLMEELEEDRESWARSEEEGWFYGDD